MGTTKLHTHRVQILGLPPDVQLVLTYNRHNSSGVNHAIVSPLAEELLVALHESVEADAQEVNLLRMQNMAERVLVLSPDDTTLGYCTGVIAHGLEGKEVAGTEGWICISIGMRFWGTGV